MILYETNTRPAFKNVLFDFDGTLADTETVFADFDCALLNEILEQADKAPTLDPAYIRTLAGNSGEKKLAIIAKQQDFDPAPYEHAFIEKRTSLRKTLFRDRPVPYAVGLFDFLDAHKGHYAMATNKKPGKIYGDLELMTELAERFQNLVFCLQDGMERKPAPDILLHAADAMGFCPESTAYIGDNVLDMKAAVNAGMIPVGFIIEQHGYQSARIENLIDAGARLIINDMNDLTPLMK